MSELFAIREALESSETLATVVHAILRRQYGEEVYTWDLMTIAMEVNDDFGVTMSSETLDRFGAIQVLMTSDAFFKRPDAFAAICNTLAAGEPFFTVFDPVTAEEAAWALSEVSLNREMLPFSYPVQEYMKRILEQDGYKDNYPAVFDHVFEGREDLIRKLTKDTAIQPSSNTENIEMYIDDQLQDMVSQFDKIPSLERLDDLLLKTETEGLVTAL